MQTVFLWCECCRETRADDTRGCDCARCSVLVQQIFASCPYCSILYPGTWPMLGAVGPLFTVPALTARTNLLQANLSEPRRPAQSKRAQSGRSTLGCARPSTEHVWANGFCETLFGIKRHIYFLTLAIFSFPPSPAALCVSVEVPRGWTIRVLRLLCGPWATQESM